MTYAWNPGVMPLKYPIHGVLAIQNETFEKCTKLVDSPKHLQEKGNLFLVRSFNNLRNRKKLTLRLTSVISNYKKGVLIQNDLLLPI
jgi:hypothetical protein